MPFKRVHTVIDVPCKRPRAHTVIDVPCKRPRAHTVIDVPCKRAHTVTDVPCKRAHTVTDVPFKRAHTVTDVPCKRAHTVTDVPCKRAHSIIDVPIVISYFLPLESLAMCPIQTRKYVHNSKSTTLWHHSVPFADSADIHFSRIISVYVAETSSNWESIFRDVHTYNCCFQLYSIDIFSVIQDVCLIVH